jgi:hypothetical protein
MRSNWFILLHTIAQLNYYLQLQPIIKLIVSTSHTLHPSEFTKEVLTFPPEFSPKESERFDNESSHKTSGKFELNMLPSNSASEKGNRCVL